MFLNEEQDILSFHFTNFSSQASRLQTNLVMCSKQLLSVFVFFQPV